MSPENLPPSGSSGPTAPATPSGADVLREIVLFVVRRARFLGGIAVLAVAAPILILGWRMLAGVHAEGELAARLTGRGAATITETFWRLTLLDPLAGGEGPLELMGNVRSDAWAVVEPEAAARAAGVPPRLAYRVADPPPVVIHYAAEIGHGPGSALRLPWRDPTTGWPRVEIRLPRPVAARLRATPADPWIIQYTEEEFAADRKPGSELDAFLIELDDPWEALVSLWLHPPAEERMTLAYDPAHPADALPLADVAALGAKSRGSLIFNGLLLLAFGSAFYAAAATGLCSGMSPRLAVPLAVAGLVALPWWGHHIERAIAWASPDAGRFVRELSAASFDELLADRLPQPDPSAEDERLVYEPTRGFFAATLAPFAPSRPAAPPADADAAWRDLSAQLAAQALALPEADQRDLLERLITDERRDRRRAAEALLAAGDRLSREAAGENLRAWARSFLLHHLRAVNDPDTHELAFAAKLELRRELASHPDPEVRAAAARSLARIEEWRRRTGG